MFLVLVIIAVLLYSSLTPAGLSNLGGVVRFFAKGLLACAVLAVVLICLEVHFKGVEKEKVRQKQRAESSAFARSQKAYDEKRASEERRKAWWADFHALHPDVPLPASVTVK